MNTQRGSTNSTLLLAVLLALTVMGGGAYFIMQQNTPTLIISENSSVTKATSTTEIPNEEAKTPVQVPVPVKNKPVTGPTEIASNADSETLATQIESPYGCYAKTKTGIYDISAVSTDIDIDAPFELPADAKKVQGADVLTFDEAAQYGVCFGLDKNHVYQGSAVLSWGDPATFKLLWYTKPGPTLFFRNGSKIMKYAATRDNENAGTFSEVPNADPESFGVITSTYDFAPWANDKNNVYCNGNILADADSSTLKIINQGTELQVKVKGSTAVYNSSCEAVE